MIVNRLRPPLVLWAHLETDAEKGRIAPAVILDGQSRYSRKLRHHRTTRIRLTMIVGEPCLVLLVGVEIVEDDLEPCLWIRRDNLIR
jgi:hypothetical protein